MVYFFRAHLSLPLWLVARDWTDSSLQHGQGHVLSIFTEVKFVLWFVKTLRVGDLNSELLTVRPRLVPGSDP